MVYRDISDTNNEVQSSPCSFKYKANLLDRFFSTLIDYLVISPYVSFFIYLFYKDSLQYVKSHSFSPDISNILVMISVSYVLLFALSQAIFIFLWKATPGQYFLKLQIVFENSDGFIFWRALLRQLGFFSSFLLLGIPWLALLAHDQQKTFYDRLADSRVLSKKNEGPYLDFEVENTYWRAFTATLMLFVFALVASVYFIKFNEVNLRALSFKKSEKQNYFCAELKNVKQSNRLELALAMNLVGQLSDDCLDREADFVLWQNIINQTDMAYLAKALTEEDQKIETNYLSEACNQQSHQLACQVAESLVSADFDTLYSQLKNEDSLLAKTLRYEVGIKLGKLDDQMTNLKKIFEFQSEKLVKKYLLTEVIEQRQSKVFEVRSPAQFREESLDQDNLNESALELIKDL